MLAPVVPQEVPRPKGIPQTVSLPEGFQKAFVPTHDELKLPNEIDDPVVDDGGIVVRDFGSGYRDPVPTIGCRGRRSWSRMRNKLLDEFLEKHGFRDLHTPRQGQRSRLARVLWGQPERICALHEAARSNDYLMVRLCLRRGVDPAQRTSKGRSALDLAMEADSAGSHREVIRILAEPRQTLSVKGFLQTL